MRVLPQLICMFSFTAELSPWPRLSCNQRWRASISSNHLSHGALNSGMVGLWGMYSFTRLTQKPSSPSDDLHHDYHDQSLLALQPKSLTSGPFQALQLRRLHDHWSDAGGQDLRRPGAMPSSGLRRTGELVVVGVSDGEWKEGAIVGADCSPTTCPSLAFATPPGPQVGSIAYPVKCVY